MERLELKSNRYGKLIFDKDAKVLQCLQCMYLTKVLYPEDRVLTS